jgi:thiamine pyrophosphate-dependent acetolactate synthase large subunit-like protein
MDSNFRFLVATRSQLIVRQLRGVAAQQSKALPRLRIDNPSLDWVKLAEAQGVPATRATTAEEFHTQFDAAMSTKGPRLIEAQIVQNLQPMSDYIHDNRG